MKGKLDYNVDMEQEVPIQRSKEDVMYSIGNTIVALIFVAVFLALVIGTYSDECKAYVKAHTSQSIERSLDVVCGSLDQPMHFENNELYPVNYYILINDYPVMETGWIAPSSAIDNVMFRYPLYSNTTGVLRAVVNTGSQQHKMDLDINLEVVK